MGVNTKYKDSVFSFLFNDPAALQELYGALEGVTLPPREREGGHGETGTFTGELRREGPVYGTDYGFALEREEEGDGEERYERRYTWDERNRMTGSRDAANLVQYRYGEDGERAVKYAGKTGKETLYFSRLWQVTQVNREWRVSKHVYVGNSRLVTKNGKEGNENTEDEGNGVYYYHGDHLGSAQVVTDREGKVYERYEYTPYGEVWIEWENRGVTRNGTLPYRFTGKELDEETGLYYYGARYLDPRASRWLSADPAVGEYLPEAPTTEEARKRNGNLPGTGGIYNYVNLHVYHYAGNNPVKYVDPDGRQSLPYFTSQGYFGYLLKHNPVMSLLNIINSALSGDKSAQTQAGNIAAGTVNQIANDALNATKTAVETTLEATADTAGFVSSATGSISVGTALVGIEGVSAGAAVTSDIAGLVEVGSRTAKGVISGDTGDQKEAKNVLRRYAIGMAIGAIIGGFKGNNPLHNKPIADKIVDFSTKIVPQIYSEIDKQISQ